MIEFIKELLTDPNMYFPAIGLILTIGLALHIAFRPFKHEVEVIQVDPDFLLEGEEELYYEED